MENSAITINEQKTATAFSKQSIVFDNIYSQNTIVNYKRERVRNHLLQFIKPGSSILELNSGTGEDASWFANNGYTVHATDISEGMQSVLQKKIKQQQLEKWVTTELCSFTQLEKLKAKGPYDVIFSNFAGLNCTGDLGKVLQSFPALLNPGGIVTLVIMPEFCLWETSLLFKGKFKTALRRPFSKKGVKARVEGESFTCWYYNASFVIRNLSVHFKLLSTEGLCTIVPPSYIEHFAERYPKLYNWLKKKEEKYKSAWPWKTTGDYYIISFQKKSSD
ncbi:MAG: class I SAM-dependent methyltransferase [Bacteroidetes bacterium]|nr:class I SAM-dependent methyltransferase [Bacteroidota bacterium]